MDKSSVSRAFKSMHLRGLITIGLDDADGRLRVATITHKGRALHDEILKLAMERERAFLSALNDKERENLIGLLRRLHDNLPVVEKATQEYLAIHHPKSKKSRRAVGHTV
jgi:DNA-binding MarR family transcriptional regulator